MDIKELKIEKTRLEAQIMNAIEDLCGGFRSKTGVSIERISVDFYTIETMGEEDKYEVSDVSCELAL